MDLRSGSDSTGIRNLTRTIAYSTSHSRVQEAAERLSFMREKEKYSPFVSTLATLNKKLDIKTRKLCQDRNMRLLPGVAPIRALPPKRKEEVDLEEGKREGEEGEPCALPLIDQEQNQSKESMDNFISLANEWIKTGAGSQATMNKEKIRERHLQLIYTSSFFDIEYEVGDFNPGLLFECFLPSSFSLHVTNDSNPAVAQRPDSFLTIKGMNYFNALITSDRQQARIYSSDGEMIHDKVAILASFKINGKPQLASSSSSGESFYPLAVLKQPGFEKSCSRMLNNTTLIWNKEELSHAFNVVVTTGGEIQRYIKPKGSKAWILRVIWRKEGAPYAYVISNTGNMLLSRSNFITPSLSGGSSVVKTMNLQKAYTIPWEGTKQISQAMARHYGLPLSELALDWIQNDNGEWFFIQVKAFKCDGELPLLTEVLEQDMKIDCGFINRSLRLPPPPPPQIDTGKIRRKSKKVQLENATSTTVNHSLSSMTLVSQSIPNFSRALPGASVGEQQNDVSTSARSARSRRKHSEAVTSTSNHSLVLPVIPFAQLVQIVDEKRLNKTSGRSHLNTLEVLDTDTVEYLEFIEGKLSPINSWRCEGDYCDRKPVAKRGGWKNIIYRSLVLDREATTGVKGSDVDVMRYAEVAKVCMKCYQVYQEKEKQRRHENLKVLRSSKDVVVVVKAVSTSARRKSSLRKRNSEASLRSTQQMIESQVQEDMSQSQECNACDLHEREVGCDDGVVESASLEPAAVIGGGIILVKEESDEASSVNEGEIIDRVCSDSSATTIAQGVEMSITLPPHCDESASVASGDMDICLLCMNVLVGCTCWK